MTVLCILDAKGKGAAHIAPDATIAQVLQSLESQNVDALVVSCDGSAWTVSFQSTTSCSA